MVSLLLAIIYLAFISLGLPDSLLGSAWPVMRLKLGAPISYAGIISMIIALGTIISSLLSSRMIRKFGPGLVTAVSVGMTAAALFGFSISSSFILLCLWAIPYGLGAGAVDAALNNYVAVHYSSRQMSWLHAFWGVGVTISPYIMSVCLTGGLGWQAGYRTVSILQVVLTVILFAALPLWKRSGGDEEAESAADVSLSKAVKIPGVPFVMLAFFGFCALETTAGLWADKTALEKLTWNAYWKKSWTGELLAGVLLNDLDYSRHPLLAPYRPGGSRSDNPYVNFYWDFCSEGKPCFAQMEYPSLDAVIGAIHQSYGLAVLAHPGVNLRGAEKEVEGLISMGLDGLEAFSSYHTPEQARFSMIPPWPMA